MLSMRYSSQREMAEMFKGHWDFHLPHHSREWHCIQKALSQHWSLTGAGKKQSGPRERGPVTPFSGFRTACIMYTK